MAAAGVTGHVPELGGREVQQAVNHQLGVAELQELLHEDRAVQVHLGQHGGRLIGNLW